MDELLVMQSKAKLEHEMNEVKTSCIPLGEMVEYLKSLADDFPELFLSEEKTLVDCLNYVENQLKYLALSRCNDKQNYTISSSTIGVGLDIKNEETYQIAVDYYFLSGDELKQADSLVSKKIYEVLSVLRKRNNLNNSHTENKIDKNKKTVQSSSTDKTNDASVTAKQSDDKVSGQLSLWG